jgi:hypothetical protein
VSSQEEDKETSDDEGSEAGWNSEIIALGKRDFDDEHEGIDGDADEDN